MAEDLVNDMLKAMDDDTFNDVTLVGTDKVEVPCMKSALATRSPVFKSMFYGEFKERNDDKVQLNYPSCVLQVLVKYCYSDEVDLAFIYESDFFQLSDNEATLMVKLRDAANYFQIQELFNCITVEIGEWVFDNFQEGCVCAILAELSLQDGGDGEGGHDGGALFRVIMELIYTQPEQCLLPDTSLKDRNNTTINSGVLACPPRLLRKIIDAIVAEDPFVVVQCLQRFFQNQEKSQGGNHPNSSNNGDYSPSERCAAPANDSLACDALGGKGKEEDDEERTDIDIQALLKIAEEVDLTKLQPAQLAKIEPCSLFPMERLYKALVFHASGAFTSAPNEQQPPPNDNSNQKKEKTHTIYVAGAGLDCLNGRYERQDDDKFVFKKQGKYGDIPSTFTIANINGHWELSACCVSPSKSTAFIMYRSEDANKKATLPFTYWKCCIDGISPAPYVVMLHKDSKKEIRAERKKPSRRRRVLK